MTTAISSPTSQPQRAEWHRPWPVRFVFAMLACQIGLLFLGDTPLRLPLRIAVYGASLFLLLLAFPPRGRLHPAYRWAVGVAIILCISLLHPGRSSILSAVSQVALYIAILAPIVWVASPRAKAGSFEALKAVILLLWAFSAASAGLGVLQVYYPGHFDGALSENVANNANFQLGAARVVLADGTVTQRPMGLTDSPGGAAQGGLNAIVLGAGILLAFRHKWLRAAAVGGMLLGVFSIMLSQVRVSFVMALLCIAAMVAVLAIRGRWRRLESLGGIVSVVLVGGLAWAFAAGGDQTIERFGRLVEEDPGSVYYDNRGHFIVRAFNDLLPEYPFGAGLGRWGMMNKHFGTQGSSLWSELIWTSWLFDGGVPLIIAYAGAFGAATLTSWRLTRRSGPMGYMAVTVFAYNLSAWAATLVFPIFSVQLGLEVWLLNACLWAAAASGGPQSGHLPSLHSAAPLESLSPGAAPVERSPSSLGT